MVRLQLRAPVVFLMALGVGGGCRVVRSASGPPVPMIGGLRSFQTPEEAKRVLSAAALQWSVLEDGAEGGKEIPFRRLSLEVRGFVSQEVSGDLILQFLNDRLMRVMFYPVDPDRYLTQIQNHGMTVRNTSNEPGALELRESDQPANLQILLITDHEGKHYVAWTDVRLDNEYHDLIWKYS